MGEITSKKKSGGELKPFDVCFAFLSFIIPFQMFYFKPHTRTLAVLLFILVTQRRERGKERRRCPPSLCSLFLFLLRISFFQILDCVIQRNAVLTAAFYITQRSNTMT